MAQGRIGSMPAGVLGLAAASAVEWAGATAVLPILPLFIRHHGAPDALVGVVMGAFLAASFLVQYPLGRLSDRVGRRGPLVASLVGYAAVTLVFALPVSPLVYILLRALQGVGAGTVQVVGQAVVADLVPADRRGRAYGLLNGSQFGGMIVGPLAGALLYSAHPQLVFVAAAAAALLASVTIGITIPRRPPLTHRDRPAARAGDRGVRRRAVAGVLVVTAGWGLLIGVYDADWSLLLRARGAPAWAVGLSFTLFAVPLVLASWPAGWLADHWDRRWLGGIAGLVGCACAVVYPFLPSPAYLMTLGVVEATATAIGLPAVLTLLMEVVGTHDVGRAQGLAGSAQTGAAAVGALAGGALFGVGIWIPFVAAAALVAATTMSLPVLWGSARRWARAGATSAA